MSTLIVKKDFIPTKEEDYFVKTENFCAKAPTYVAEGVLPETETADLINEIEKLTELRVRKNRILSEAKRATTNYTLQKKRVDKKLRKFRKKVEINEKATTKNLVDLGLTNTERIEDITYCAPKLKVTMVGGSPQISYTKNAFDGIKLFCKRNGKEYDFSALITKSKFLDDRKRLTHKQSEIREYFAFYSLNGQLVGQKSETVAIVLDPMI